MLTLNSSNPTSLKTTSELDISINIAMKLITFVLVSVALCSQQVVHGSPVNDLALAIHKMAMSNNEIKSQAQELFVKAIAEELSNELKQVLKQTKSSLRNEEMALIAQNAPVVDIRDCGTVGNTLNAILQPALFWIPQGELSILVDCGLTSNCTQVRVEVPTGTIQANVEVCFDQGMCFVLCTQNKFMYISYTIFNMQLPWIFVCEFKLPPRVHLAFLHSNLFPL